MSPSSSDLNFLVPTLVYLYGISYHSTILHIVNLKVVIKVYVGVSQVGTYSLGHHLTLPIGH